MSRRSILGTLLPGFEGTTLPEWVEHLLGEGLAGVCLFGENIATPEQLRALTTAITTANPDALIAIDEEGGDVTRLFYDRGAPYPGNAVLGRLDDLDATRAVGAAVGRALHDAGVNLDFAPDADVNSNPENPVIGVRSFGADPELAARHTLAWTEGLQSQGVAACLKHFPGHGDTAEDSHLALPTVAASPEVLRARELVPFAAAVATGGDGDDDGATGGHGARTVMTSHIVLDQLDPGRPATFSRPILEGILRDELGFTGVIVSDALDMAGASGEIGIPAAAVAALAAGCDLLCIGTKNTGTQLEQIVTAIESAVDAGDLPVDRVQQASRRTLDLAAWLRAHPGDARSGGTEYRPEIPDARAVASSFGWSDEASEILTGPGWQVVRVETAANSAIGSVPWGPFRALDEQGAGLVVHEVTDDDWRGALTSIPDGADVLVIGKDNERRPEVVALIDALRERRPRVVAVDMGWPGADSRYAGVRTYGASALVGQALALVLGERGVRS